MRSVRTAEEVERSVYSFFRKIARPLIAALLFAVCFLPDTPLRRLSVSRFADTPIRWLSVSHFPVSPSRRLSVSLLPVSPLPCFPRSPLPLIPSDATLVSTATREGRRAVFDDVWQTIQDRYYDSGFGGIDWSAQRNTFRPLAADAGDTREFYALLRRMIGSLHDPHTRVFAPDEKFDWWSPRFVTAGLTLREVEGLPTVVQVERRSEAERAGVRAGDVIEVVDGNPVFSIIRERQIAQASQSTNGSSLMHTIARLLEGKSESSVELRWQDESGREKSARFHRYWQQRQLGLRSRSEGKYSVIQIDVFTESTALDLVRLLKQNLRTSRGIVIDLRENGGGDAEAMAQIASDFLAEGINLGRFTDRQGNSLQIETNSKSFFTHEKITPSNAPLVLLTSERTASAAEIFVSAMKRAGRATVIGTETCGCVLAIRTRHSLPDGGMLDVSELDYRTSDGVRLEGRSTKPDLLVSLRRKDLYTHRDRALEAAIERLGRISRQN